MQKEIFYALLAAADRAQADPQVLLDLAPGTARQADRERKLAEVVAQQGDVGGFERNVRTRRAHRDPDGSIGHRGRVVDAGADDGYLAVAFAQGLDRLDLLFRYQVIPGFGEIDRAPHRIGDLLVVTRDHHQALDAEFTRLRHHAGCRSRFSDFIFSRCP